MTSEVPTTEVPTSEVMVRTEALRKSYGTVEAVRGVSLEVQRGQVVVVIGPSGCGKSTFLRCINLLEEPSAGTLQVGDRSFEFGPGKAMPHGRDLLAKVGLASFTARFPRELSGGQQQRVAIARAMAMQPEIMLFDEVTSALDPELVGEVLDVMKQLAADGTTMIVVTHEMAFAHDVADHVVVMEAGQVVEQGPADEVLLRPKNARTASFLSRFHSTIGERKA